MSDRDLQAFTGVPGVQRMLLVALVATVALFAERALEASVGQIVFIVSGVILLMVLAVIFRAERRLPLLCDPLVIVFAFMAQFFVIGAPALFLLDFYIFRPLSPERGAFVLGLFAVFVGTFFVGYQTRLGAAIAEMIPNFEGPRRRMPWVWFETVVLALAVMGCLGFVASQHGILGILRTGYGQGDQKPIYQLAYHTLLGATFLMAWRVGGRERTSRLAWVPFVTLIAAEVIFFGVLSGARKWLFYIFFGLVCMRVLRHGTRNLHKVRVAVLFSLLIVFFSVWGTIRSHPVTELVGVQATDVRSAKREAIYMGFLKSVSEPFEVASLVVDVYPGQQPYEHGRTLLVTVLGFIPRSVWPDKPVGLGKSLTRYTDGYLFQATTGHSITPTLVGDFYANFGALGVALGGVVFGIVCRVVAAYAATGMKGGLQLTAARVLIPSVFIAGLAEVRGGAASMLAFYVMVLAPIVIGCSITRVDPETGTSGFELRDARAAGQNL